MLILVVSWISCINAVDNQHLAVNAVSEAVQQSVRFAANDQYALDWSDLEFDNSFDEWIDKWTAPAESHRIVTPTLPSDMTFSEAINAGVMNEKDVIRHFATKNYDDQLLQERSYQEMQLLTE